jgi:uncharacterized protein YjbJ (UPF0337 family)
MTQTYSGKPYSDSGSHDKSDADNQSSNEIRADINQTRANVGEKIDQLQARLDPNRLKQQAQETVQEMLSDTANSMTDYVRSHKDEMLSSIADSARRNPLPTALVGLGLGWLILESMAGNKRHDDDRWEYERRNLRSRQPRGRFEGSSGRSFVSQGRGQYMEEDFYSPEYYNQPDYGRSSYPPPSEYSENQGSSNYQSASDYRGEFQGQHEYGNGHRRGNPLAKAADAVKDTVSDISGEIKERVEDAGQEIKERFDNVSHNVSHEVKDRMGDMRQQADHMRDQGQHSMQRAGHQMEEWQRRARYEGQRRGQQVMRNLEDNPLTYGALALAAGAALALLLPQTRTENRYFGEMRDQVMEKGQEVFESAKDHAQQVATEMRPELEEKARQIYGEVKEEVKQVAKDVAEEVRPVIDKAMEKGKEEARNAAQEIGVDPDKLMGSKPSGGASGSGSPMGSASGSSASTSSPTMSSTSGGSSSGGSASMSSSPSSSSGMTTAQMGQGKTPVINRDTLAGQWKQVKGEIKSRWGRLTDDELTQVEGDYEKLLGKIQSRYGYSRERVEQEVNDFFKSRKA